jgi:hypothetical protein
VSFYGYYVISEFIHSACIALPFCGALSHDRKVAGFGQPEIGCTLAALMLLVNVSSYRNI